MLFVGLGGAIGAMLRYVLGLVPMKTEFPVMTLIINLIGALLIGLISGLAMKNKTSDQLNLFLKTGLCGGFTTFSTFSLETFSLIENGKYFLAGIYMSLSVGLCLLGIFAGMKVAGIFTDI